MRYGLGIDLAAGALAQKMEHFKIEAMDFGDPYNIGECLAGVSILPNVPAARASNLSVSGFVTGLRAAGIAIQCDFLIVPLVSELVTADPNDREPRICMSLDLIGQAGTMIRNLLADQAGAAA